MLRYGLAALDRYTHICSATDAVRDRTHDANNQRAAETFGRNARADLAVSIRAPTREGAFNVVAPVVAAVQRQCPVHSLEAEVHRDDGWGIVLLLRLVLVTRHSDMAASPEAVVGDDALDVCKTMLRCWAGDCGVQRCDYSDHNRAANGVYGESSLRVAPRLASETRAHYAAALAQFCAAAAASAVGRDVARLRLVRAPEAPEATTVEWKTAAYPHGECGLGEPPVPRQLL